jgi:hypothetical protein
MVMGIREKTKGARPGKGGGGRFMSARGRPDTPRGMVRRTPIGHTA